MLTMKLSNLQQVNELALDVKSNIVWHMHCNNCTQCFNELLEDLVCNF